MKNKILIPSILRSTAFSLLILGSIPSVGFCDYKTLDNLEKSIQSTIEELRLRRHSIETSYNTDGDVIISGYVSSQSDKDLVAKKIQGVHGVKSVQNTLSVKENAEMASSDPANEAIRQKALLAVREVKGLGSYNVDVKVDDAAVHVTGNVAKEKDLSKIEEAVEDAVAPKKVVNGITVTPKPTDAELAARVRDAFNKEKDLNAEDVQISAHDGTVTLKGSKANHRIVDRILSIANMVDGVEKIDADISVQ